MYKKDRLIMLEHQIILAGKDIAFLKDKADRLQDWHDNVLSNVDGFDKLVSSEPVLVEGYSLDKLSDALSKEV